jgi:hypothetical protein
MKTKSKNVGPASFVEEQRNAIESEYLRVPAAVKYCGLSKSHIYELASSGEIKSACIRRRGSVRGVRLIHRGSLADFIEANSAGGGVAGVSETIPGVSRKEQAA